jgi:hypothetical protein
MTWQMLGTMLSSKGLADRVIGRHNDPLDVLFETADGGAVAGIMTRHTAHTVLAD